MHAYDRYRMDGRTVEQFAADIERATRVEREIVDLYVQHYKIKYGIDLDIEDNGCDNSGQLLGRGKVSTKADFKLDGKPVEVKFNKEMLAKFHFKVDQLNSYLKQEASVIWVNGWETKAPVFTVLKTIDMESIKKLKRPVAFFPWGGKMCYELDAQEFRWLEFERGTGKCRMTAT